LVLLHLGLMPVRVAVLVFGRDVCILLVSAILYAAAGRRDFKPSVFGKANTLAQVLAVAVVILHQLTQAPWVSMLETFALWSTMVLTVVSGLHYAWMAAHKPSSSHSAATPHAAQDDR
jgi:cardiolipin synthase (CMP-forming)